MPFAFRLPPYGGKSDVDNIGVCEKRGRGRNLFINMKVINLGAKNSVLNKFMLELRDENIQKNRMRFRENIKRISYWITAIRQSLHHSLPAK